MNRSGALFILAITLAMSVEAIFAQDFRVDLFTRSGVKEVVISPGAAAVEVCGIQARGACLNVPPGDLMR